MSFLARMDMPKNAHYLPKFYKPSILKRFGLPIAIFVPVHFCVVLPNNKRIS
jgi:hypothetical protein